LPTVEISPRAVERVRGGHPWVHRDGLAGRAPDGAGDLVLVVDRRGVVLGSGLWSATSPIALRMLSREALDPDALLPLVAERIVAAEARRRALHASDSYDAWRVVHGEADLLPGLFIDRYADVAVVQTAAAAMDAREDAIARILIERLGVRLVVARDDGGARDFESLPRRKGVLAGGGATRVAFHDAGSAVEVDVLTDGKTGGFLDQQENHARAATYVPADAASRGFEALDAFSYHGGFALSLARAGARVVALDESAVAVERLRANAARNRVEVSARAANAFDELRAYEAEGRRFDLVVIDPPALAKRRSALPAAERAYKELNLRGLRLLRPGGVLFACSCSARMTPERFGAVLADAAHDAGRPVQLLERRGAGRDHPPLLGVPETEYLKCWVLRVVA
jgi:23S rRNA (cytosine1962-C5)-methyltransferase